jgi:tRNA pseudouridine38-40 synthase
VEVMTMQVCITLRFDGTEYHGFQVQKNALTVCQVLQDALERLYGVRPPVKGCSRTDAGVHALGYCVSYMPPKPIDPYKLPLAINRFLPPDIRVCAARLVGDDFHARYSAVSKEYVYRLRNSAVDDPFTMRYAWRLATPLHVEAMQQAAQYFVGTHDFRAFMSAGSDIEDTVRTVHFFTVKREGEEVRFHICADGYLYNMVRILVGTLVEVGAGRMQPQQAQAVLQGCNRSLAGDTVPAKGLFLYRVNYGDAEQAN